MSPWLLVLPAVPLLWMMLAPRSMWRRLYSWQYRNPAAVEPSADGYHLRRAAGGAGLIALLICGGLWSVHNSRQEAEQRWQRYEQQRQQYEDCRARHRHNPGPYLAPEDPCVAWSPKPLESR